MGWSDYPLSSLTLPQSAGPGQTRLVLGSDLPPPLDTYLFFGQKTATVAIIYWSGTPSNDDYQFEAIVELPGTHYVYRGSVLNGAVIEESAGKPAGYWTSFSGGGQENFVVTGSGSFTSTFTATPGAYFRGRDSSFPPIFNNTPIGMFDYLNAMDPSSATDLKETWHTPTLLNGWTGKLKYRLVPSPALNIEIRANLVAGTKTDATIMAQLPSFYWPSTGQDLTGNAFGGTLPTTQLPHANVDTGGAVRCYGLGTSTNLNFYGTYALDF